MCDKVRRTARAAKLRVSADIELPAELIELVEEEAKTVYRVMGTAASVLVLNDLGLLRELSEQEESAHGVYEEFFRSYNRMAAIDLGEGSDDSSYDDLRRVIMASRYLDRCAQYSIDAAARILFLLTGQRWNQMEIATFDEDELEGMRVPAGEGAFLDPASDAPCVARIPRDELDPRVRELIEGAAGVSPAE